MAEASLETTRTVHLILPEDEAEYLINVLRNPPFGCQEMISEQKIRENIFTAVRDALEER